MSSTRRVLPENWFEGFLELEGARFAPDDPTAPDTAERTRHAATQHLAAAALAKCVAAGQPQVPLFAIFLTNPAPILLVVIAIVDALSGCERTLVALHRDVPVDDPGSACFPPGFGNALTSGSYRLLSVSLVQPLIHKFTPSFAAV